MIDLGKVRPGSALSIPFGSFAAATGVPSAVTNFADADIQVYKNGGTTQRASAAALIATNTFDSLTGINLVSIDMSDNTTAGFWAAGSEYFVVISDITVDGQTLRFPIARFKIGIHGEVFATTIATLASQTSFTLSAGSADDNAYIGCIVYIHDVASVVQCCFATVSAYTGATKTVTLAADPAIFTMAATDNISLLPPVNVRSIGGVLQTGTGTALTAIPWNAAWDAEVQSEVQGAIEANHLDHLLAADYDPAAKPGVATALLNELVESDAGVSRYTINALEQGPSGSGASAAAIADEVQTRTIAGVTLVTTLTTYTGNTLQTGDAFARLGAPAGASVSADIAAVEAQTDDIGAAGAGLTAVPWNAAWDAQVESEVTDALTALGAFPSAATVADEVQTRTIAAVTMVNGLSPSARGDIVDDILDETTSAHAVLGSVGEALEAAKDNTAGLTFTDEGELDINLRSVNSVTITGTGTPSDPWRPA